MLLLLLYLSCKRESPISIDEETLNPVSWKTSRVSLKADHFFIIADGDTFYSTDDELEVDSDPGDSGYCTLEVTWIEKEVEMRLYIYFYSDGTYWWSNEFRTYNGKENGDWIYYYGTFFKSKLGTPFTGSVEIESDSSNYYKRKVHFTNLRLQAFL
jgi:hypothetical protein